MGDQTSKGGVEIHTMGSLTADNFGKWQSDGLDDMAISRLTGLPYNKVREVRISLGLPTLRDRWLASVPALESDEELFSIFIGSMIGDGGIPPIGKFEEAHSVKQESYLRWKMERWGSWVASTFYKEARGTTDRQFGFRTRVHPELQKWRKFFYPGGSGSNQKRTRKRFTKKLVEYVTPLAIAIWFQDDGTRGHTPMFGNWCDPESMGVLCDCLWKFGIRPMLGARGRHIFIPGHRNADKFRRLVEPHIHVSMRHKLQSKYRETQKYQDRTIYKPTLGPLVEAGLTVEELAAWFEVSIKCIRDNLKRCELEASRESKPMRGGVFEYFGKGK